MENKSANHHGFGNGFILGLLVGIVATLLLTTKKGRSLLRDFTDKGMDKFSDLEDKFQEKKEAIRQMQDEYEEMEEGDDFIPEEPQPVKLAREEKEPPRKVQEKKYEDEEEHEKPRRFFRIKKH